MKKLRRVLSILVILLLFCATSASAFRRCRPPLLCDGGEGLETFLGALQEMTTSWQDWSLKMSDDIGQMADRIVTTEVLIGQMADRIVTTEALMAQLTVVLAQLAAGQEVDPALLEAIQQTVTEVCTREQPVTP
ncbi:MAG TPA: hypothetical protein ENK27_12925 [Desulfobulbus sp.]|nr:hypothetical protein [Desulfobulbus sp.]